MEPSEAIDIRLRRARSWLRKARKAESAHDADAEFIFLWIAFNALYGTRCETSSCTGPRRMRVGAIENR
jgi:hypothetical protein